MMKRDSAHRNRIALLVTGLLMALTALSACFSGTQGQPTETPPTLTAAVEAPTAAITFVTPTSSRRPRQAEVAQGATGPAPQDRYGEINVEYPLRINPEASDVVRILVQVPPELASSAPVLFDRIIIPLDAPPIVGQAETYRATILVSQTIRMELSSPTLGVQAIQPDVQKVDLSIDAGPTLWAWFVVAPKNVGLHTFALKVFLGDDTSPSWIRAFQIEVVSGTGVVPTPVSFIDRPGGVALIGALATVIAALIGLLGVFISQGKLRGLTPTEGSRKRRLAILERNLAHWRQQAAGYGALDVPVRLHNQIQATEDEIVTLKAKLKEE